jgi:hypothetical protein
MHSLAHNFLTDQGAYVHMHIEADFYDAGGPESGPMIHGHNAFDLYSGDSHEIIIQYGLMQEMQLINWDEVRFFKQMEAQGYFTDDDDEIPY